MGLSNLGTMGMNPARRQQEAAKLAAQYAHVPGAPKPNPQPDPEAMLDKIRAESYAHIMGHEQAHKSAAGAFGGSIAIEYDQNGVAVAGHVPINIPELDPHNPAGSIQAYETIRNAALAPGDPSGQDKAVAAQAQALMGQAQVLMAQKRQGQRPIGQGGVPFF